MCSFVLQRNLIQDRPQSSSTVPSHDAQTLTRGGPLAHIVLDGQIYTLRITRAGKLILTK